MKKKTSLSVENDQKHEEVQLLSARVEESHNEAYEQFFATIDPFINSLDHTEIINDIISSHPKFSPYNTDVVAMKNEFLEILDDNKFITNILTKYNINIFDFFQIIYKPYFFIFKGPFIKKIKLKIIRKKYVRDSKNRKYNL